MRKVRKPARHSLVLRDTFDAAYSDTFVPEDSERSTMSEGPGAASPALSRASYPKQ